MTQITLKGNPVHTVGNLPLLHNAAPDFQLVDEHLKNRSLKEFSGKRKIIATVPSMDTETCSVMTQKFNTEAQKHPEVMFITVSADLPFAQKRFCKQQEIHNVLTLSMMRDKAFGKDYGVLLEDGPLAGILARSVFVLDDQDRIVYAELVPEITQEPNYHKAIEFLVS